MQIEAWRVHDTGLVAVPGPFRRLGGAVRHLRGRGEPLPARVTLVLCEDELVVDGVGSWPRADVVVRQVSAGPPVTFILQLPDATHLLAAPADATTTAFLAALSP